MLRRMHGFAEHRETARVDDGDRDVLAVRERDDWILDAQPLAEFGVQGIAHDTVPV